ncbi:MAG TPA: dethiobiotin synthase [Chthoniobacterales bacterium]|nr:dethiobiotin synthase [Chthoniobacterales bacterium]
MSVFLTGTDTGVGKTHTAITLLRLARGAGLRCAGMKPICCGDRRDAELLLAESSEGLTIDELNPVWLKTPAAPLTGSLIEGVEIDTRAILAQFHALKARFDAVVVEGVGGWLVPIRREYFVSDLAKDMALPIALVVLNRLGCLNHTMLTIRSIAAHGLTCAGITLNTVEGIADLARSTNKDVLAAISGVPILPELHTDISELPREWREILVSRDKPQP